MMAITAGMSGMNTRNCVSNPFEFDPEIHRRHAKWHKMAENVTLNAPFLHRSVLPEIRHKHWGFGVFWRCRFARFAY